MRSWRFGLAVLILLAMVGNGAANLVRVARSSEDAIPPTTSAAVSQSDGPLTMEAAYVTALADARTWSPAATLTFASLQADWPLDPREPGPAELPPGGWVRFAFLHDAGSVGTLRSIVIERYSGEIVTVETQRWEMSSSGSGSLPVARTSITSGQAVEIAEGAYGQAFRLECPIARHETDVTLISASAIATPDPYSAATPTAPSGMPFIASGTPVAVPAAIAVSPSAPPAAPSGAYWLVTYRDGAQPGINTIEMEIDATTGATRSIRDRSQGCSDLGG